MTYDTQAVWDVDITAMGPRYEPVDVSAAGAQAALDALFGPGFTAEANGTTWLVTLPEEAARELAFTGSLNRVAGVFILNAEAPVEGDYEDIFNKPETKEAAALRVAQYHVDHCGAVVEGWISEAANLASTVEALWDGTGDEAFLAKVNARIDYALHYYVALSKEQVGNVARLAALQ